MNSPFAPFRPLFALAWLALAGCNQPALDPALVAEHRSKLTLADEPDGAQTVLDVRNTMMGATEEVHDHEHADHDHADHDHEASDADNADHDHDAAATDAKNEKTDLVVEDAEDPAKAESDAAKDAAKEEDHEHAGAEEHADHDHDHADHDHEHADHDHDKKPVIEEMDVVMVGTVGGVPNPSTQSHPDFPFAKRQAVFFLADPEAAAEYEEHAHQHAPGEECAFCSANAAEAGHMVAVVQFSNQDGKPLAADVRDLFDLKENDTVVVKGKAKLAPGGMLTVDATGLYVRR